MGATPRNSASTDDTYVTVWWSPYVGKGARVLYDNNRGPHANLAELSVAKYRVIVWFVRKPTFHSVYLRAPCSGLWLPQTEALEFPSRCPAYGSVCQVRISSLRTEHVWKYLSWVICKGMVKFSLSRTHNMENLQPQFVRSIINRMQ